jgi:hypothetical protein
LVRAFVLAGGKPRREETTLAALVATWRRLRRDEDLPALTAIDQLRAFLTPDQEAIRDFP